MDKARYKIQRLETKVIDDRRVEVIMSTEAKDRDGDIIRVSGWNLASFLSHPILLSSHNYYSLSSQIGEWEDVSKKTRGDAKMLTGVANYYVNEGNAEADWGYNLASKGRAAYSVGFIPDMAKATKLEGDNEWYYSYDFNGQELLECSHVTVPSNPEALQRIKGLKLHPDVADIIDEVLKDSPAVSKADMPMMQEMMMHMKEAMKLCESMMGEMDDDEESEKLEHRIAGEVLGKITPPMEQLTLQIADYLAAQQKEESRRMAQIVRHGVKEALINGY